MAQSSSKCCISSGSSIGSVSPAAKPLKCSTRSRSASALGSLHSLWARQRLDHRRPVRAFDGTHAPELLDWLPSAAAAGVLGLLAAALRPSPRPRAFAAEASGDLHAYAPAAYSAAVSTGQSGSSSSDDSDGVSTTIASQEMPIVVVSAAIDTASSSDLGMLSACESDEQQQQQQQLEHQPSEAARKNQENDTPQQEQQQQQEEEEEEEDSQVIDPEALRLMVAASILARESSQDTGGLLSYASTDGEDDLDPRTLALLEGAATVDDDSLAVAVGILRQHCSDTDDCALSERLHHLLQLLDQRPGQDDAAASASANTDAGAMLIAGDISLAAADGFWSVTDEWADIRSALFDIGIEGLGGDSDTEMEGSDQTLGALRRLGSDGSAKLAAFLQELQQRRSEQYGEFAGGVMLAANSADSSMDGETSAEIEAEARWWESVVGAYDLLWAQAVAQQQQAVV